MIMYLDIETKAKYNSAPYIDGIVIEHPIIGEITLDWDESDRSIDESGMKSSYRMKGIRFTTYADVCGKCEYANGKLDIIKESKFKEIIICDENDNEIKFDDLLLPDIEFRDGDEEYIFRIDGDIA